MRHKIPKTAATPTAKMGLESMTMGTSTSNAMAPPPKHNALLIAAMTEKHQNPASSSGMKIAASLSFMRKA